MTTIPSAYRQVFNPANGHYYTFVSAQLDWQQAEAAAEAFDFPGYQSTLATITSGSEQAFVAQQFGVNFDAGSSS